MVRCARVWGLVVAIGGVQACVPDVSGLGSEGTAMPVDPSSTGGDLMTTSAGSTGPVAGTSTGAVDPGDTTVASTSTGDTLTTGGSTTGSADTADTGTAPKMLERCAAPNATIPDADLRGASSGIDLADAGTIVELSVVLRVSHDFVGDLSVELGHGGTVLMIVDRPGAGTPKCSGDDIDMVLRDDAPVSIDAACLEDGEGPPPALAGDVQPDAPLDPAFVSESMTGSWRLVVVDHATQDQGTLTEWCLRIGYE